MTLTQFSITVGSDGGKGVVNDTIVILLKLKLLIQKSRGQYLHFFFALLFLLGHPRWDVHYCQQQQAKWGYICSQSLESEGEMIFDFSNFSNLVTNVVMSNHDKGKVYMWEQVTELSKASQDAWNKTRKSRQDEEEVSKKKKLG